jgi:hypothetical protein
MSSELESLRKQLQEAQQREHISEKLREEAEGREMKHSDSAKGSNDSAKKQKDAKSKHNDSARKSDDSARKNESAMNDVRERQHCPSFSTHVILTFVWD